MKHLDCSFYLDWGQNSLCMHNDISGVNLIIAAKRDGLFCRCGGPNSCLYQKVPFSDLVLYTHWAFKSKEFWKLLGEK